MTNSITHISRLNPAGTEILLTGGLKQNPVVDQALKTAAGLWFLVVIFAIAL